MDKMSCVKQIMVEDDGEGEGAVSTTPSNGLIVDPVTK